MDQIKGAAVDRQRLENTIARVIGKFEPEQIILFGSAARNAMSPDSDVDLLVITDRLDGDSEIHQERWGAEDGTCYDADLIMMDRVTAEAGRSSIARIQGVALEEGRTVYTRPQVDSVPTGPEFCWNGREMVKTTKFEPEEAVRLVEDAEQTWEIANHPDVIPRHKCRELQLSMEYALKALTIAQGERVEHKHTLNELWDAVEARGERIGAARDRKALKALTLYSGRLKYESPTPETDPVEVWNETRLTGRDLLAHTQARVPELIKQAVGRLQENPPVVVAADGAVSLDGEAGFELKPPDLEVLSGKKSRTPVVLPKRPSAEALEDVPGNSRVSSRPGESPPRKPRG